MSIVWKRTVSGSKDINADNGTFENLTVTNFIVEDFIIDDLILTSLTVTGSTSLNTLSTSGSLTVNGALATLPNVSALNSLQFRGDAIISQNTSDGSDSRYILLTGGGADGDTRGGRIVLSGNERASFGGRVQIYGGGTAPIQFYTNGDTLRGEFETNGLLTLTNGLYVTGSGAISNRNTQWLTNGDDIFINASNNFIHLRPEPSSGGKGQFYITLTQHAFRNNANADMITINKDTNITSLINGSTLNVGTTGTSSNLNVYGLITSQNGLTVASGTTTTQALNVQQALTASTTINVTGTSTLGLTSVLDTLEFRGNSVIKQDTADGGDNRSTIITGGGADGSDRGGRIVLSGNERVTFGGRVQIYAGTTAPIEFFTNGDTLRASIDSTGLLTVNNGITIATGQTLNVGTSGTSSPANIYGLLTVSNGITLTGGTLNVPSITASGATYTGAVVVNDSTASTSTTTGSIRTTGGISSSNTTDATSSTNGGSCTLGGGLAVAKKVFSGETITSGQSIVIGQNGSQVAGSIYSDSSYGMLLRARQASPSTAEYRFANSANSSLLDITGSIVTTGLKYFTSNTTEYSYAGNDASIRTAGGIRAAKGIYAENGFFTSYGKGLYLDPNWTNNKILENEFSRPGGLSGDATYLYSAGTGVQSSTNPIIGYNATSWRNYNTTQSSSLSTGAEIIDGGLAVAKNLYCGGDINLTGNLLGSASISFTPTLLTDTSVTYSIQAGRYVRMGPMIFCQIVLATSSAISLSAQNLVIQNLPFASGAFQAMIWNVVLENYEFPSGTDTISGRQAAGATTVDVVAQRDTLGVAFVTAPSTSASRIVFATGFYFTA